MDPRIETTTKKRCEKKKTLPCRIATSSRRIETCASESSTSRDISTLRNTFSKKEKPPGDQACEAYESEYFLYLLRKLQRKIVENEAEEREGQAKRSLVALKKEYQDLLEEKVQLYEECKKTQIYGKAIESLDKDITKGREVLKVLRETDFIRVMEMINEDLEKISNSVTLVDLEKKDIEDAFKKDLLGSNSSVYKLLKEMQNYANEENKLVAEITHELEEIKRINAENEMMRKKCCQMADGVRSKTIRTNYDKFYKMAVEACKDVKNATSVSVSEDGPYRGKLKTGCLKRVKWEKFEVKTGYHTLQDLLRTAGDDLYYHSRLYSSSFSWNGICKCGMDQKSRNTVAINSRNLAEHYIKSKNFGRAFSHFLIALKLVPEWKTSLKEPFSAVLFKWGIVLENINRFSDLFNCYEQAIEAFPENEYILDNLGAILLKHGLIKEAAHYFRKSLNVRPRFLRALRNLENVSNLVVPRWHFRMLNDSKRNGAFREAVRKKVRQGWDTVLDIGTGTGILSLFALEAGAKKIFACDSSPFMIDVASLVFQENNASCIHLISKHSQNLEIPEDVPERVKMVVTEIVDCGLLGENILETLVDSWDRLLCSPSGVVIPLGAVVYVSGIECDYIRKKHVLTDMNKSFNINRCYVTSKEDSYDSENLKRVPNGFKYLTDIYNTFFINFNDKDQMEKILAGELDEFIQLKCLDDGRLDCLVVWFDLYIDEDIVLDTRPNTESNDSWDQAVFPLPKNFHVTKDERVNLKLSFKNGKIAFHDFKFEKSDSDMEMIPSDEKADIFRLSEDLIRILNSNIYENCFNELYQIVKKPGQNVFILDTFPFPFFGLNFLMKDTDKKSILKAVVRDEDNRNLLKLLAKKYDLEDNVTFIEEEKLWIMDEDDKYDIILLNLIENHGELKDKMIPLLDCMRSHLKPNGLLIPEKVTVIGQLIESEWLEKVSKIVGDEVTFGYKVGKFINCYQVNTHIDFDLNGIEKITRSEPFEICSVLPGEFIHNKRISTLSDGNVNALAIWYHIRFLNEGPEISTLYDQVTNHTALLFPKIFVTGWMEMTIIYDNGVLKIENL